VTVVGTQASGLDLKVAGSADAVTFGDTLTYTISISNTAGATLSGLSLNDNLAANATFVSSTVSPSPNAGASSRSRSATRSPGYRR